MKKQEIYACKNCQSHLQIKSPIEIPCAIAGCKNLACTKVEGNYVCCKHTRVSTKPKPRDRITGKFVPTRNPKSERVYLTIDEKDLILALRGSAITPQAAAIHLNKFFGFERSVHKYFQRARELKAKEFPTESIAIDNNINHLVKSKVLWKRKIDIQECIPYCSECVHDKKDPDDKPCDTCQRKGFRKTNFEPIDK